MLISINEYCIGKEYSEAFEAEVFALYRRSKGNAEYFRVVFMSESLIEVIEMAAKKFSRKIEHYLVQNTISEQEMAGILLHQQKVAIKTTVTIKSK